MRRLLYIFTFTLLSLVAIGQDVQYTQYFSNPLYLNPALAGSSLSPRLTANYRIQWPKVGLNAQTTSLGYDMAFENINSGVGVLFNLANYSSILRNTEIGLIYSYNLQLGDATYLKLGVQGNYVNRGVSFDDLLFYDQIISNQATQEKASMPNVNYMDFSSGAVLYGSNYWFGLATHHINRPYQSILETSDANYGRLPMKISLHGGFNIVFDEFVRKGDKPQRFLSPAFNYRKQAKFEQLDLGVYGTISPMMVGLWYRGVPIKKDVSNSLKNESLGLVLGYRQDNISIGYNFDLSISKLRPTGGSHEISVIYRFEPIETRRHKRRWSVPFAVPEF